MARIYVSLLRPGSALDCVEGTCADCGRLHDKVWRIRRSLADTFGHFAVFRINGEQVPVDASLPHRVDRLPRGAEALSPAESARLWHDDNESHVFGGPNVAEALRDSIARTHGRSL
jgi:hypothetical protein